MAKGTKRGGEVRHSRPEPLIPPERRIESAKWQRSYGTFITGQSFLDEVTLVADRMETKWGAGQLRLIVGPELRDKFDRQRFLLNQAMYHGELEDVRVQASRMIKAWNALDRAATDAGLTINLPEVWDHISEQGNVYAFVRHRDHAKVYMRPGREAMLYTLEEVCRILDAQRGLTEAKEAFPVSEVIGVQKRSVGDVLDDIWDTSRSLDDPLDDDISDMIGDIPY